MLVLRTLRNPYFLIPLFTIASSFVYEGAVLTGMLLLVWFGLSLYLQARSTCWNRYPLSILMLIYLVWLAVVAWASSAPNTTLLYSWILAGLPIGYLAWNATPEANKTWLTLRLILLASGLFLAVWGIWQVLFHQGEAGQAVGPLVDKNAYAALINLFWFPTAFYFVYEVKQGGSRLFVILTGLCVFTLAMALFATESRGGIGTWLLLLPVMLWAVYRYSATKKLVIAIFVICAMSYGASLGVLGMNVGGRTYNLEQDTSTNARLLLWESSIQMTKDHPLLGTGWGTFAEHYPAYRSPLDSTTGGYFAHNDYLQLATEGGVIAMLLQLSVMVGVLLQLRRSLKQTDKVEGFESVSLLLGALALFIHAGVNFIFYFAFMDVLSGLYIARATQLVEIPRIIRLPSLSQISQSVKILSIGFVFLIFLSPLILHLAAQECLTGSQPGLKVLKKIDPDITAYDVAKMITAIRPTEVSAQLTMLDFGVESLKNSAGIRMSGGDFQTALMDEVLERYDFVRKNTANNPDIGVAEAKTLIKYHDRMVPGVAYAKAQAILMSCLQTNPFHADSMIELARLQAAEGHRKNAMETLQRAIHKVLTRRDEQLVQIEILRQLAAPRIIQELNKIEKTVREVRFNAETGKPIILASGFDENIDAQLHKIEKQIGSGSASD